MKFLLLLSMISFIMPVAWSQVVLLDPGHGGEEIGALGYLDKGKQRKVHEKDLALRLAVKVRERLQGKIETYLTRSVDRTVGLQERADLAEKLKADLFISIHFNSSTDPKAHGFETYYLDNSKDAAVRKVESAENLSLKGEELIVNQILVDLVIQQTVTASKRLAGEVHGAIKKKIGAHKVTDRGIRPGLFYVLALSKRPGLLLEVGFVSNMNELKKINQESFLDAYATGVAQGILDHFGIKK